MAQILTHARANSFARFHAFASIIELLRAMVNDMVHEGWKIMQSRFKAERKYPRASQEFLLLRQGVGVTGRRETPAAFSDAIVLADRVYCRPQAIFP
jgi:hypothetical protein